jgi:alpha-D-ribose 1-methylphosphonate 5-triphosphate synthase subunit PhnG
MSVNGRSQFTQGEVLSILTHAPAAVVQGFADGLLPALGQVEVIQNRTGLIMLPAVDSAEGTTFHLGEVLVAEAHVRIEAGAEGYAVCLGRDPVTALAIALLDAALQAGIETERITAFVAKQAEAARAADDDLLRGVAATRVQMETF